LETSSRAVWRIGALEGGGDPIERSRDWDSAFGDFFERIADAPKLDRDFNSGGFLR
jgi:hypothetical protein